MFPHLISFGFCCIIQMVRARTWYVQYQSMDLFCFAAQWFRLFGCGGLMDGGELFSWHTLRLFKCCTNLDYYGRPYASIYNFSACTLWSCFRVEQHNRPGSRWPTAAEDHTDSNVYQL